MQLLSDVTNEWRYQQPMPYWLYEVAENLLDDIEEEDRMTLEQERQNSVPL
jgi:hypothetical protein